MIKKNNRWYIAAPLFTPKEKKTILEVAAALHRLDQETYLPMEHGVHDAWELPNKRWGSMIYELDVAGLEESDWMLVIYNGMNSDSGTAWESGYAHALGKKVVIFHNYDTTKKHGSVMVCNGSYANITNLLSLNDIINNGAMPDDVPYQS